MLCPPIWYIHENSCVPVLMIAGQWLHSMEMLWANYGQSIDFSFRFITLMIIANGVLYEEFSSDGNKSVDY